MAKKKFNQGVNFEIFLYIYKHKTLNVQTLSLHTATWQMERRNTLSLGYCFSANIIDVQGKPNTSSGFKNDVCVI